MFSKYTRTFLHYIISIYIVFGGIIFNHCQGIYYHILFNSIVILHWLTNNNKCFLTEYDYENGKGYTISILNKFGFNLDPKNTKLSNIISYMTTLIPLYYSYTLYKKCV